MSQRTKAPDRTDATEETEPQPDPMEAGSAGSEAPSRKKRARTQGTVLTVVVVAGMIGVLGASLKVGGPGRLSQDPSGVTAPDFTLPLLDGGGSITLSDLRGKPVLLNFWASWCHSCKLEAPILAAGYERWRDEGVVFLGVDAQDSKVWAQQFEKEYGIGYQSVVDTAQEVMGRYGVLGFPETFFIDKQGSIVAKYIGPLDAATLDAYVGSLLG